MRKTYRSNVREKERASERNKIGMGKRCESEG